jgi:O-antigen/teichoic acid export membrane protein
MKRFRQGTFLRSMFLVMSGTGLAQVVTFLFSPVISRLYGPGEFGLFGSFSSLSSILGAVITLQFAEALMLPAEEGKAVGLFAASCMATLALSLVGGILFVGFPHLTGSILRTPGVENWLWLIPVTTLLAGLNQSLTAWYTRQKAFKSTAVAQVLRSLAANGGQTAAGIGHCGTAGLIGGNLLGELVACSALLGLTLRGKSSVPGKIRGSAGVLGAVREYKDFPLYSAPQNLLNAVSQGAPVILLIHYYGLVIGGFYGFSVRVLQFPMTFVLTSLRQVLFQRLSEIHNSGRHLSETFGRVTLALLGMALVPAAIMFVFAPGLFALAFGEAWRPAGTCARWLLVWLIPGFCNLPAALTARILRQQKALLVFEIGLVISRLTVLVIGGLHFTAMQTIAAFSIVGGLFNSGLILWVMRLVKAQGKAKMAKEPAVKEVDADATVEY